MNELTLVEAGMISVYVTDNGECIVDGRELWKGLKVGTEFSHWVKRRLSECDAAEGKEYSTIVKKDGRQTLTEYLIKLDTAKEMAMLERNEIGKQYRRYLIEVEKKYRNGGGVSKSCKSSKENLASINNAAKILLPILKQAGCAPKIQLLTIKSLYEKSGVMLPLEIDAGKQYYDTKHIARQCGMYTKSGNPAYKAAGEIAKKLELREDQFTDTWETKGNWEGTVRKYDDSVIAAIKEWLAKNGNPEHIEYQQCDGQIKNYHVCYKLLGKEVA